MEVPAVYVCQAIFYLLENTHFPPKKMEELVLQLVLPGKELGVTVVPVSCPRGQWQSCTSPRPSSASEFAFTQKTARMA